MANNNHICRNITLPIKLDAAINRWSGDLKITPNEFMVRLLAAVVQEMDDELDEIWAERARIAEKSGFLTWEEFNPRWDELVILDEHEPAPDVSDVWEPGKKSADPFEGMYSEDDRDPFEGMYESDERDQDTTYE